MVFKMENVVDIFLLVLFRCCKKYWQSPKTMPLPHSPKIMYHLKEGMLMVLGAVESQEYGGGYGSSNSDVRVEMWRHWLNWPGECRALGVECGIKGSLKMWFC